MDDNNQILEIKNIDNGWIQQIHTVEHSEASMCHCCEKSEASDKPVWAVAACFNYMSAGKKKSNEPKTC